MNANTLEWGRLIESAVRIKKLSLWQWMNSEQPRFKTRTPPSSRRLYSAVTRESPRSKEWSRRAISMDDFPGGTDTFLQMGGGTEATRRSYCFDATEIASDNHT